MNVEMRSHFAQQDRARATAKAKVIAVGERLPNGDPTPEMLAFMALCREQVSENMALYAKNTKIKVPPKISMREYQQAFGVSAKPLPAWQDNEAVRRNAEELGMIQHDR